VVQTRSFADHTHAQGEAIKQMFEHVMRPLICRFRTDDLALRLRLVGCGVFTLCPIGEDLD
jgi:hypothetical protein